MLGKQWTYQQDSAKSHTHQLTQNWFMNNFPGFYSEVVLVAKFTGSVL